MGKPEVVIEFNGVAVIIRYIESFARIEIDGKKFIEIYMQSGRVVHIPDVKQNWGKLLSILEQYHRSVILL